MDIPECDIFCGLKRENTGIKQHSDELYENDNEEANLEDANTSGNERSKWGPAEIKLLLSLYKENVSLFRSSKKNHKSLWNSVAKQINNKGYTFTGNQCDLKFRKLKKTYKRIKYGARKTGRFATNWSFFPNFEDLFSTDISSPYLMGSLKKTNSITVPPELSSDESSSSSAEAILEAIKPKYVRKRASLESLLRKKCERFEKRMLETEEKHNKEMALWLKLIEKLEEK